MAKLKYSYNIYKVTFAADDLFPIHDMHYGFMCASEIAHTVNQSALNRIIKMEKIQSGLTEKAIINNKIGMSYTPIKQYKMWGL